MIVRHQLTRLGLAVILCMGAAGCANWHLAPLEQRVLAQYRSVQQWSPERFDIELPVLEQAYAKVPSIVNRLRLAVSLGFGRCRKCDPARAHELFKETLQSSQNNSVVALVTLALDLLEAQATIADKSSALLNQQQRLNELQQKLDDLTSIEESLHLRE